MSNLPLLWAALLRTSLLLLTWVTTIAEKTQLLLTELIWYVIPNILPSPITSSYLADLQSSASHKLPTTRLLSYTLHGLHP